jgi:hypothetical protein
VWHHHSSSATSVPPAFAFFSDVSKKVTSEESSTYVILTVFDSVFRPCVSRLLLCVLHAGCVMKAIVLGAYCLCLAIFIFSVVLPQDPAPSFFPLPDVFVGIGPEGPRASRDPLYPGKQVHEALPP